MAKNAIPLVAAAMMGFAAAYSGQTDSGSPSPAFAQTQTPAKFPRVQIGLGMLCFGPDSGFFKRGEILPTRIDKGYYENAPLVAAEPGGNVTAEKFKDLYRSGLRAWSAGWNRGNSVSSLWGFAEAARLSGTGMTVFPTIGGSLRDEGFDFLKDYWLDEKLRSHPNVWRIDGRPVVMCWPTHSAEVWRERIKRAEAVGGRFFIINELSSELFAGEQPSASMAKLREDAGIADAIYYFADRSHGIRDEWTGILPGFRKFAGSLPGGIPFGGTVRPGKISCCRVGSVLNPRGTEVYRMQWLEVIAQNPDFVHITTPDDYSEATEQDCSGNSTFTFIDMNRYFGERWRLGAWPEDQRNQSFVSYRKIHAVNEPLEMEIVLLRPEIRGDESSDAINAKFQAKLSYRISGSTEDISADAGKASAFPGHLAWRFWIKDGVPSSGFITPKASILENGLLIVSKASAPAVICGNGESVVRKWLHVPLHRLRELPAASLSVEASFGSSYPRRISAAGIPWDELSCGILEMDGNPLGTALDKPALQAGFIESYYGGHEGWTPMKFNDMWAKRNFFDSTDRYSAVLRFKDDTFAYLPPVALPAPRVQPETVEDLIFDPSMRDLYDRGPLGRDVKPAKEELKSFPRVSRSGDEGPWFLKFTGRECVNLGDVACPPGPMTVDLWVRAGRLGERMIVFGSWPQVLDIHLRADGRVEVLRLDRGHYVRRLKSENAVKAGSWVNLLATWDGRFIRLYINGQPGGEPIEALGARTAEYACLGKGGWYPGVVDSEEVKALFKGDIARYRLLQKALSSEEVKAAFEGSKRYFPGAWQ